MKLKSTSARLLNICIYVMNILSCLPLPAHLPAHFDGNFFPSNGTLKKPSQLIATPIEVQQLLAQTSHQSFASLTKIAHQVQNLN
jgi:uncharacterized membrane protein